MVRRQAGRPARFRDGPALRPARELPVNAAPRPEKRPAAKRIARTSVSLGTTGMLRQRAGRTFPRCKTTCYLSLPSRIGIS